MKTADIKRKNGYYKVFHNNEWRIAYWYIEGQCWFLVGVEKTFNDSEMDIIIETPITFEQTQPVSIGEEVEEDVFQGADGTFMSKRVREIRNNFYSACNRTYNVDQVDEMLKEYREYFIQKTTPSTTDTQDGKLNETFHNYGYPTDGGILGTEVSVKIDNQSNEETPSTTDIEKEAEDLYPFIDYQKDYNSIQEIKRSAYIKSCQMHRNDGLDKLIEWIKEGMKHGYSNQQKSTLQKVIDKANEIKASLK